MPEQKQNPVMTETIRKDHFDRALGALVGMPNVLHTAPSTVRVTTPLVGMSQTFIIQTYRQYATDENDVRKGSGDTVFIEYIDEQGSTRMVLPPHVTKMIARQRDALSDRARRIGAKAAVKTREKLGIKPGFLKNKKK